MPVTMKDIAMLIGISRQAVAAALESDEGNSRVSKETREKVLKLAKELNYIPNIAARTLKGGRSRTIGILAHPGMPHSSSVLAEICRIINVRGYNYIVCDLLENIAEPSTLCLNLATQGVCGIIMLDAIKTPSKIGPMPDLPIVVCRTKQGFSDIDIDKEKIGYIATEHLLKHGHKQVFYLGIISGSNNRRMQGWKRALQEHNATGKIIDLSIDGGASLAEYIKKENVTAVFCSNDFLAAKTIRFLIQHGVRVPEDVAIVGCDGNSFIEFTSPSVTSVIQGVHELSEKCVDMLFDRMDKKIHGIILEKVNIPPRLWTGGSCGCKERQLDMIYRLNSTGNLEKDYRLNFNTSLWENEGE